MARPKGSKNRISTEVAVPEDSGVEPQAPPMADCIGLIEYVGPEGCVQYMAVEFVQGVPREVSPEIFAALSNRAVFKVV